MPRFFVEQAGSTDRFIVLEGKNAVHAKALRLKNGDAVTVCDGSGTEYRCTVCDVSKDRVSLVVHGTGSACGEAKTAVTVYMGFAKADKFEHVIQKATELGATELVAFPCARCVSRPDEKSLGKKLERWRRIAVSAAEQSRRSVIPKVTAASSYEQMLRQAAGAELPILFYENERSRTLKQAMEKGNFSTVALITGPEGGFEAQEVAQAEALGIRVCTLGRRILRCETAPLCALSAIMYAAGEF